jgi:hypothetical protein
MKHRFLIHELSHTTLLVDISDIGLPAELLPPEGKLQSVPSLRFQGWHVAEQHLRGKGAGERALIDAKNELERAGVAVLTIV